MYRPWAFWRRVQYVIGIVLFFAVVFTLIYFFFIRNEPTCFDDRQNGDERGIDCGGSCVLVCPFDVLEPTVAWSRALKVSDGVYNAVAYVENKNLDVGTRELSYTFTLFAADGSKIAEKTGTTFLPPDSEYPIFEGRISTGNKVPAQTTITLAPVTRWEVFTDNRAQFTVNSRALVDADTKPRLEASLTNTSLNDARSVEIIATIFNAKGNALTASRTVVPLFEGRTEKVVTFTWPEPIAKTITSCEIPTDVIMAIDLSGSMDSEGGTPPEPITSVLRSASGFVERLRSKDQIGIATFATGGTLSRSLTGDTMGVGTLVQGLTIDPKEQSGGTNVGDAILVATEEFESSRHNPDARKVLIVFTDGKTNEPDPDPEAYAIAAAQRAKDQGITIITIGLGEGVEDSFLTSIASDPAQKYRALDKASLDGIYRSITTSLCEDGAAVIDIVPKVIGELNDNQERP
ncbi:VWA domain-containing protein [Patescibacteria group bacterium]|nr:VWA domain-containing protein [Patescibacteria group bacterium]